LVLTGAHQYGVVSLDEVTDGRTEASIGADTPCARDRRLSFPGFPPGLPRLPADAPHMLSVEQREAIAQAAVAGKSDATRAADLLEARWAVDAIDAAFARAARSNRARRGSSGRTRHE
jgi:hypothetical protein